MDLHHRNSGMGYPNKHRIWYHNVHDFLCRDQSRSRRYLRPMLYGPLRSPESETECRQTPTDSAYWTESRRRNEVHERWRSVVHRLYSDTSGPRPSIEQTDQISTVHEGTPEMSDNYPRCDT